MNTSEVSYQVFIILLLIVFILNHYHCMVETGNHTVVYYVSGDNVEPSSPDS
jgi:hypothetical protein